MDPIKLLSERCAGREQSAVAAELGISAGYLNDVLHRRKEAGPKILRALGIMRETRYRRVNGKGLT